MAKPNLRLPFLKKYHDRHGKLRFYHRPTGTPLPGKPGSREFMTAYNAACGEADVTAPILTLVEKPVKRRTHAEGSIDWLVTQYFNSDAFTKPPEQGGLADETKAGRRRALERFRADHGDKPLGEMQAIHIKALMDQIEGGAHPKRNWLKHISGMFVFAEEALIRVDNPCRGFKRPKAPKSDGFHSWTDPEIAQYRGFWPNGTMQRL
jgi:hypothetical protein